MKLTRKYFLVSVLAGMALLAKSQEPVMVLPMELDSAKMHSINLSGHFTEKPGVKGNCLNFDGFTTQLSLPAEQLPANEKGFTIEAWIAPQEYSWGWTGIFDQAADTTNGFSFGINYLGKVGFQVFAGSKWHEIITAKPVPLLEWSHIAGSFDPENGFSVFINGELAVQSDVSENIRWNRELPVLVGKSQRKQFPALTERKNSKQFLSTFYFDGLIDELKIYAKPLAATEIKSSFQKIQPSEKQPLQYRKMPSGPANLKSFGAFYTNLQYCPEWDRLWPVGQHSDVLVGFDELPVRMVFWRGTGYCPAWVSSNDKWVADQGPESWNWNTVGCFEQMSDKQCRYSHVRIIENSPARIVVHWRTASPGIDYSFNHVNPETGWGEWTDEYYYIYPDAVAVRYQEIHSPDAANMEWQQSEILNQPGTCPQDNVELKAATIVNMKGESETWSWEKAYGGLAEGSSAIKDGMIQVLNLKSPEKHFVIGENGASWKPFTFGALEGFSTIPCWNHWPVAQLPNEGRVAPVLDRPSSACVGTLYPVKHKTDNPGIMVGRNLYGMTAQSPEKLAVLARSWNFAPELLVSGSNFQNHVYNKNQRAYFIRKEKPEKKEILKLTLSGNDHSPVLNPAFVIENWGNEVPIVKINGKKASAGKDFRMGFRNEMTGTDLIIWVKTEQTSEVRIEIGI